MDRPSLLRKVALAISSVDEGTPSGLLDKLRFEGSLIVATVSLFGISKGFAFASRLPLSILSGSNAQAYDALGPCEVRIPGMKAKLRHVNVALVEEILVRRIYTPNPFFSIGRDATVIDAGANIGIFSILAAQSADRGRVISVEPEAHNFRRLEENIAANGLTNVTMVNAALSDIDGTRSLNVRNRVSHSIVPASGAKGQQECRATTLETLMRECAIEKIDFLKMDIEGAEFQVFTKTDWLERVKALAMEIHPRFGDSGRVLKQLDQEGFSTSFSLAGHGEPYLVFARRT